MHLLGVTLIVQYVPDSLKAQQSYQDVGDDWSLEIDLHDGRIAVGGTFPKQIPGVHPMMLFHNDKTFLGVREESDGTVKGFEQPCHDLGMFGYLDEKSRLPEGWKFREHVKHEIFSYFRLTDPFGVEKIGVIMEEVLSNHHHKNGCHKQLV